jgi:hypothetical protein
VLLGGARATGRRRLGSEGAAAEGADELDG